MTNEWKKIVPMTPPRDRMFMTCGGVTCLDTEEWEKERWTDILSHRSGPKLGEAGSDEDDYSTVFIQRKSVR